MPGQGLGLSKCLFQNHLKLGKNNEQHDPQLPRFAESIQLHHFAKYRAQGQLDTGGVSSDSIPFQLEMKTV